MVLRTWVMESPHNYEDSKHENTVFLCPGATYFEVDFDEHCMTEKRYVGVEVSGIGMRVGKNQKSMSSDM